jgi:hypothetical protein
MKNEGFINNDLAISKNLFYEF